MFKKGLAIIPARGGSKRLPRKNIMPLCGKPLIAWTIEAARTSNIFQDIVVSTDDYEIAKVSEQFGAQIPFMRSEEYAQDDTTSQSVVKNILENLTQVYDYVVLLQPTSPLRRGQDIIDAYNYMEDRGAETCVSVVRLENDAPLEVNQSGMKLNGAIYIFPYVHFQTQNSFVLPTTCLYEMPLERSIDIDTQEDMRYAEYLMKHELQKNNG